MKGTKGERRWTHTKQGSGCHLMRCWGKCKWRNHAWICKWDKQVGLFMPASGPWPEAWRGGLCGGVVVGGSVTWRSELLASSPVEIYSMQTLHQTYSIMWRVILYAACSKFVFYCRAVNFPIINVWYAVKTWAVLESRKKNCGMKLVFQYRTLKSTQCREQTHQQEKNRIFS